MVKSKNILSLFQENWVLEARMIFGVTALWLFMGLLVLYSASSKIALQDSGDAFYYVKQQLLWICLGLVLLRLITAFPLRDLFRIGTRGLIFMSILLAVTLFFSAPTNGSSRWIELGPVRLQPSELIKPFLLLQAAQLFGHWHRTSWPRRRFWLIVFGVILLLILVQPSLSMTMFCSASLWLIALGAGLPIKHLLAVWVPGGAIALLSILINPYQRGRIEALINPLADPEGNGFQLIQSLMTVSSGELWGRGFGKSLQNTFLPEQYTDFVFSVFAEEYGLVGAVILILLLLAFAGLGMAVSNRAKDPVVKMVALGATVFLVGQSLFHIGVTVGLLPTTGITFPFFSYGGSSMVSSLALAGLLIRAALEMEVAEVIPLRARRSRRKSGSLRA
ncbi:MAG: FtsW/RodA/SpoVE family cell cycle protein [Pseudanabaenaceae cyanobacterium bins.68]|nr:FtsW/RodA/SpoVE family cell cycle protein [Pseudanabaenaceae cyanobacterium bins.68]